MRVIPVIDLKAGQVVRGIGGRRHEYQAIVSQLVESAEPAAIAQALRRNFGISEIYVADLDAITRGAFDCASWQAIAAEGVALLIDAGIGTVEQARVAQAVLTELPDDSLQLVIGLESLERIAELKLLVEQFPAPKQAVFSLDLRAGKPHTRDPAWQTASPLTIAAEVVRCGIQRLIVLDLADVGGGAGISTLPLVRQLRQEFPHLEMIAGGGVRGIADLRALREAGGSAALVASALHDGRLSRADLMSLSAAR